MDKYYIFKSDLDETQIKNIYYEKINCDKRYDKEFNEELLSISKGYIIYPFINGMIKNHDYLVVTNGKQINGRIDVKCSFSKGDFLLNGLNGKDFLETEIKLNEMMIFNQSDIIECEGLFVNKLIDRATNSICDRHNLILTNKENKLDIAPIGNIDELNKIYYLEEAYKFVYHHKSTRKGFKSVYSTLNKVFYEFDYAPSLEYKEFYKSYKKPVVYIPKKYLNNYYELAFNIYLKTQEELKYLDKGKLYRKLKDNISYKEYSRYESYLNQLIFYYRKKAYLRDLIINDMNINDKIFYYYLTLKYLPSSGYELAELVSNGIIEDNYVNLLKCSSSLGYAAAKRKLYDYYNSPRYYDEYNVKKYS